MPFQTAMELELTGRLPEAEAAYRRIVTANPDHAEACYRLGGMMLRSNQPGAIDLLARSVRLAPANYSWANDLGVAYHWLGQIDNAITCYQHVIAHVPDHAGALSNLAEACRSRGQIAEGLEYAQRAIAAKPYVQDGFNQAGLCLLEMGKTDQAMASFRRAMSLNPTSAEPRYNLGNALVAQDRIEEAIETYQQALALNPQNSRAMGNLAVARLHAGDPQAAIEGCRAAIALDPNFAEAHMNLGMLFLLTGQYAPGFAEHEWRLKVRNFADRRFIAEPAWDGSTAPKPGESVLLIHSEQGVGDSIQFSRFVPAAKARQWKVILEAHPKLCGLMRSSPALADISIIPIATPDQIPPHDARIPLLSLPQVLGLTDPAGREFSTPLPMELDAALREAWQKRVADAAKPGTLKVGVAWSGNPTHPEDRRRSLRLASLAPLDLPGVSLFSLQFGPGAAEAAGDNPPLKLINLTAESDEFAETAAMIEQLDLVITADTAIAHLAASLGKPTWIILYSVPDWRWMLDRSDSPWYPTIRIFRQVQRGEWDHPVAQAAKALAELAAAHANG
jgi:tetratricopeptide (TPR) repeat protein